MHESIQTLYTDLEADLRATAVPVERQEVIAGQLRRLPVMYTKFRETNDSRHSTEITRVVQAILKDLEDCPEARKLDVAFREKLRSLHEELGIPNLILKAAPAHTRPKKARKK